MAAVENSTTLFADNVINDDLGVIESLQENNILMASWIDDMGRK